MGIGTARDVSQASTVPRTRVYANVDEHHERGLVDVQHSSPKQFLAISTETVGRTLAQTLQHRGDVLQTALGELEAVEQRSAQRGVWTVDGQSAGSDRVLSFVADAADEIVYMTVEKLLTDDVIEGLAQAADRHVSIKLAGNASEVQTQIRVEIPGATMFESLWIRSDTPAGRLMMVDGQTILVSALVDGVAAEPGDPRSETAVWDQGETNSLVVVLKAIFTWRLGATAGD